MTTDTEHDPSAEHAPFDAERLEHLADLAESHQALKRGMNLRELERLAHIDKIASGLSADEKHATKDDPNVINNRNMIENLKR
ncbi:MAG: hypothetical protein K9L32_12755, partial [Chromatiaceae bacterium]|nr:hypothetical protein [Chromatiaceae bacterium]